MNIILPMAGRGARFAEKGFSVPKPLITVGDRPMFAWALETIKGLSFNKLIIVSLEEHKEKFDGERVIRQHCPSNTEIVFLKDVTEGQLCTVLAAREYIDNEEEVLILSADTIVRSGLCDELKGNKAEGIISVADMPGDRWSFASVDVQGNVTEVAEKVRISDHASTGIYYFGNGRTFVNIAEEMIRNKEKTKGEYYVIPVYRKYLDLGLKVTISKADEVWDLGTPASLNDFLIHKNLSIVAA